MSDLKFFEQDEFLFKAGQKFTHIYMVINGIVDISINTFSGPYQLDILGRGSVIGINNILYEEEWNYQSMSRAPTSSLILMIPKSAIRMAKGRDDEIASSIIYKLWKNMIDGNP